MARKKSVGSRTPPKRSVIDKQRSLPARLGTRNTRQREAIMAILQASKGPLTMAEIQTRAQSNVVQEKPLHPGVSGKKTTGMVGIATVYRTIGLLVEQGLAKQVVLPNGETRYEHSHHGHHHDHFQCLVCDQVFDLEHCPVEIPKGGFLPGGFSVEAHELTLMGTCPDCRVKSKAR